MLRKCLEWARIPAYIFLHDPGWKAPDKLHDGTPTHVRRFATVEDARAAFAKDPRGIFSISRSTATEVHELAEEVAQASLDAHGGSEGHPAIFGIDEIVTAEICTPNRVDPAFKGLMAEARHRHVGIIAGVQSARMLNNQLLTLATHIELFQITDKRDHARLIECGIDEEIVAQAGKLPPHKSISVSL
jgi:hypothetical protein